MVLWLFTDAGSGQISSVAGWLQVAESTGCWREIPGPNANWLELIEQRQKSQWHCSQKRLAGPASLIRAWRYEWCHIYQVWDAHSGVAGWATGCDRMTLRGGAVLGLSETSGHCSVYDSVGKLFGLRDWPHVNILVVNYCYIIIIITWISPCCWLPQLFVLFRLFLCLFVVFLYVSRLYFSWYSCDSLRAGKSWDRIPVGGEIFRIHPDRPWGLPRHL